MIKRLKKRLTNKSVLHLNIENYFVADEDAVLEP